MGLPIIVSPNKFIIWRINMYDCVIDPSGSYNTWTSEFSDVDTELADAYRAFKAVVE